MDGGIQQAGFLGNPGFYPDDDRAAWLVYDEFGNPSYIATATFYEDFDDPAESQWVYRESRFDEDGIVSLDEPDVDLFDGDMALMSRAEELFDYVAPSDQPRAERIDYRRALQIEEASRRAAARSRAMRSGSWVRPTRQEMASLGYTGPAAPAKHEQAASTVVIDRTIASVRGNERDGYIIVTAPISYEEKNTEDALTSFIESTLSPAGLQGDALLDWQAAFPDAYTVALRYADGDIGDIPFSTGAELASLSIELAPAYAGADAFLQGPAAVLRALGAAAMSDVEAGEVIEAFAHAQASSPSGEDIRCAEGFSKGATASMLIDEAKSRFDPMAMPKSRSNTDKVHGATIAELMSGMKSYMASQLSGEGSASCPLGSFEACADAIETLAVRSCKEGAQAMEELAMLKSQWKAAWAGCCGTGSSQGAIGISEGAR